MNAMKWTMGAGLALLMAVGTPSSAEARNAKGAYSWVPARAGAPLPKGAFAAGTENGGKLYLCRARHNRGVHPGKVVAGKCNFGWGGREILASTYEVLVAPRSRFLWRGISGGKLPAGVVRGGGENGGPLWVCRGRYKGGVHPGKLVAGKCNIGWGGKEVRLGSYKMMAHAYSWVSASGGIPSGAFKGGSERGRNLYVCRGRYKRGLHPGKVVAGKCNIGWGGKEILLSKFQVMLATPALLAWANASNGQVPKRSVKGGSESGRKLYICRANHNGGVHPGKVVGNNCNIGWGGREILKPRYQTLVIR